MAPINSLGVIDLLQRTSRPVKQMALAAGFLMTRALSVRFGGERG